MATQAEIDAAILAVKSEWNKAEAAIKLAEQVNGGIVNPSIYELRYAGRRLVEALAVRSTDPDEALHLLQDANFDCCRAAHDAVDAVTAKISTTLDYSKSQLGANNMLTHFPEIKDLVKMLSDVQKNIVLSRENRQDRDAIYAVVQSDNLPEIVNLFNKFTASEKLMIEAAQAETRSRRAEKRIAIIGLIVGVLGILVGVAGVFFSQ